MISHRFLPFRVLIALFGSVLIFAGCSDDATKPKVDPLVASWNVTSFSGDGMDFIAQGMTLKFTLKSDATYVIMAINDLVGVCGNAGGDCTNTGTYASTATTITIDAGTEDETTFDYVLSGSTMTWTGQIDTTAVTITFVRR